MVKILKGLERIEIEAECYRLVTAYCHYVDHGEAGRIAELFTEDGIWSSPENTMSGKAAVREGFMIRENNKSRMSRHVCNNFILNEVSDEEARGIVYLTLYRWDGKEGRKFSPLEGPTMVGEYQDHFVKTREGWRIKHRQIDISFLRTKNMDS